MIQRNEIRRIGIEPANLTNAFWVT